MSWMEQLGMLGGGSAPVTPTTVQVMARGGGTGLCREGQRLETLKQKRRRDENDLLDIVAILTAANEI